MIMITFNWVKTQYKLFHNVKKTKKYTVSQKATIPLESKQYSDIRLRTWSKQDNEKCIAMKIFF